jgi:hypothetical protein
MKLKRWRALLPAILLCSVVAACTAPGPTTAMRPASNYGPLTFGHSGADLYFSQDGKFAQAGLGNDGAIEVRLRNAPFQLGYNGRQANIALAQVPISEISTDPKGYRASRLSGPMAGGREPNSDALLVYGGKVWSDGNTEFSDDTSMKAEPMPGFQHAYQVNRIIFIEDPKMTLGTVKGTLHGYIVVYKQRERMNRDIMPVRLIFDSSTAM